MPYRLGRRRLDAVNRTTLVSITNESPCQSYLMISMRVRRYPAPRIICFFAHPPACSSRCRCRRTLALAHAALPPGRARNLYYLHAAARGCRRRILCKQRCRMCSQMLLLRGSRAGSRALLPLTAAAALPALSLYFNRCAASPPVLANAATLRTDSLLRLHWLRLLPCSFFKTAVFCFFLSLFLSDSMDTCFKST